MGMLAVSVLRQCFDADVAAGALRWRVRPEEHFSTRHASISWNARHPGAIAGSVAEGRARVDVSIRGARFQLKVHRVLFAMRTGSWPPAGMEIDHANGDATHNAAGNLRPATHRDNMGNQKRHADNKSGFKGVHLHKPGVWRACIKRGKTFHLGCFPSPQEAHEAYKAAAVKLYGEFARWE